MMHPWLLCHKTSRSENLLQGLMLACHRQRASRTFTGRSAFWPRSRSSCGRQRLSCCPWLPPAPVHLVSRRHPPARRPRTCRHRLSSHLPASGRGLPSRHPPASGRGLPSRRRPASGHRPAPRRRLPRRHRAAPGPRLPSPLPPRRGPRARQGRRPARARSSRPTSIRALSGHRPSRPGRRPVSCS